MTLEDFKANLTPGVLFSAVTTTVGAIFMFFYRLFRYQERVDILTGRVEHLTAVVEKLMLNVEKLSTKLEYIENHPI